MDRERFTIILCGICILLLMLFSLRGCTPCKREGFTQRRKRSKKRGKKGPPPKPFGDEGQKLSPSVIFENQDKVTRLKSEMCDNREYMKLVQQVDNLQKSVSKIKEANSQAANT